MARIVGAVVTGGGSGLGRALARELARRGAGVVVADVRSEAAEETVALVRSEGGRAFAEPCDVREPEAVAALLGAARAHLGDVDAWVNNAGVAAAGDVGELPLDDWRWVVDVNLWGVVHGCHVAVPHLRARGGGWILNVASAAGLVSTPGMSAYNATKAAVVSLSETMYGELGGAGVKVTVLCPTFFQTNLLAEARAEPARLAVAAKLMRRSRVQAHDVARAGIDDLLAGRLYSVPMLDGRMLWRARRALPQPFYDHLVRVMRRIGA